MSEPFAEHVILELLGHRRLAGYLTEQQIAGHSFLRLDIPSDKPCPEPDAADQPRHQWMECPHKCRDGFLIEAAQFYAPTSVYAITPTTPEIARQVAQTNRPAPVKRWELEPAVTANYDDGDAF